MALIVRHAGATVVLPSLGGGAEAAAEATLAAMADEKCTLMVRVEGRGSSGLHRVNTLSFTRSYVRHVTGCEAFFAWHMA